MILKKDIDSKFVRQIDNATTDIESIKAQITTLNDNDRSIEKSMTDSLNSIKTQITTAMKEMGDSINNLIDKDTVDNANIYIEINKIYKLLDAKEKEIHSISKSVNKKVDDFLESILKGDGYLKSESGRLKMVKLPEDRLFNENFRVETITEIIREQPIIKEVEKIETPILAKSSLEHYYNYGTKLSEEVMSPKYIQGYDKLQVDRNMESFFKSPDKKIVLFKFIRTLLIIFLEDGTTEITNVVKDKTVFRGNIIKDIKDQLSIEISPLEITSIHPAGQGFYIGTINNGVLYYNIFEETISIRMTENNVVYIEQHEDKTLLISDIVSVYNEDDLRVFSTRLFSNKGITPLKVEKLVDGRVVVLCGGEQKGLAGLIYLFKFENGELTQKFIYTDPFDRRDIYFYDIISDNKTLSVIGNKDGNYVSYMYNIDGLDDRYKVKIVPKESNLMSVAYNDVNEDTLMVFGDKLVLNNKIIYGIDYSTDRDIIFRDAYAYCIYNNRVDRINVSPDIGNVFRFPVGIQGDGDSINIIIKRDGKELPTAHVSGKILNVYTLANYVYLVGAVAGDIVELNINGATIDDIALYSERTILLDKN